MINIFISFKIVFQIFPGNVRKIQKEEKPLSLSMPVITEEEEGNDNFNDTGTGEMSSGQ